MKKLLLILILGFTSIIVFAQEFTVPNDFSANKPEDYAKYESDVVKCVDWLMNTAINEQTQKRKEAYAFFRKWLTGTPVVSLAVGEKIVTCMNNPDLLLSCMGGWAKYALESKDYKNTYMGNLKGIEAVIGFYQKNKESIHKDKNVEKYIKMKENGSLEDFIKKNI